MPSRVPQNYKAPAQQRSRDSLARVYEATNTLLKDRDFDQITMAEISKLANVAIGSIYQRFGSKSDLLWLMYATYLEEATARFSDLMQAERSARAADRVETLITIVCDLFEAHRGVIKSLLVRYRQSPDSVPEALSGQIEAAFENGVVFLLGPHPSEDETRRARFAVSIILAVVREQILYRGTRFEASSADPHAELAQALRPAILATLAHPERDA